MKKKLAFVASHPMSVSAFLLPHLNHLRNFFEIHVIVNNDCNSKIIIDSAGITVVSVPIARKISLFSDIISLFKLYIYFERSNFSAVHTITPKAGLLGMIASFLARVPVRVHSYTGQVWVTRRGPMRWLLKAIDKFIASIATEVLVDSPSQRSFLINHKVIKYNRSSVLGGGSICGVNSKRFHPNAVVRNTVRGEFGTPENSVVCLYLGRLNRDKGVLDLAIAFAHVSKIYPLCELWVVGPDESDFFEQMQALMSCAKDRVKRMGYTPHPERLMQAADLFCLPSYREGFGSSVIEAAACGVPALVSRIYGLTDAVKEGQTGWMYEAGNVQDLIQQLNTVLSNPADLAVKGNAARYYAETEFAEEAITEALGQFYKKRLNETNI